MYKLLYKNQDAFVADTILSAYTGFHGDTYGVFFELPHDTDVIFIKCGIATADDIVKKVFFSGGADISELGNVEFVDENAAEEAGIDCGIGNGQEAMNRGCE